MERLTSVTSNPLLIYRNLNLVATGVAVKTSAGRVSHIDMSNVAASPRYVKLYNKATAPTVGTDTPIVTLTLPAASAISIDWMGVIPFSLGIGIGCTTGPADANSTAPTANDVIVNVFYI